MNLLSKLPKQFTAEIFDSGSGTYGCKIYKGGQVKRLLGQSSRTVSESAAVYQAMKSITSRLQYRRLYPNLVKIIAEYEQEVKERSKR